MFPCTAVQIMSSLEQLVRNLPRVHRSKSDPTINRGGGGGGSAASGDESDYTFSTSSPRTPGNNQNWAFPFFSTTSKCVGYQ